MNHHFIEVYHTQSTSTRWCAHHFFLGLSLLYFIMYHWSFQRLIKVNPSMVKRWHSKLLLYWNHHIPMSVIDFCQCVKRYPRSPTVMMTSANCRDSIFTRCFQSSSWMQCLLIPSIQIITPTEGSGHWRRHYYLFWRFRHWILLQRNLPIRILRITPTQSYWIIHLQLW